MKINNFQDNFYARFNETKNFFDNATSEERRKMRSTMEQFSHIKRELDFATNRAERQIKTWKLFVTPSSEPVDYKYTPKEEKAILEKAKWTRIAITLCKVTAVVFIIAAFAVPVVATFLALFSPLVPAFLFFIEGVIPRLTAAGLVVLYALTYYSAKRLESSRLLREARLIKDSDFKAFVQKYVVDSSPQFHPQKKDLLDKKIHDIYSEYKESVKAQIETWNQLNPKQDLTKAVAAE